MPELPEVEVVKESLEKAVVQLAIKDIQINDGNLRYKIRKREISQIIGFKIIKVKRRSKYLLFFFNKKFLMIVHLGMTGKFFIIDTNKIKSRTSFYYKIKKKVDDKYNRVIFTFKDNSKLIYNDVRKFGFIKLDLIDNLKKNTHLKNLGPEPLSNFFHFKYFKDYLIKKKKNIKNLLMDQKFVSGLGNIYVNEVLFLSQINPSRKVYKLRDNDIKNIIKFTKKILKKAILLGGSSIKNFSNSKGQEGNFQENFNVYGRIGRKCSNSDCKGKVKKIAISNRSSFFCPNCQKY